MFYPTDRATCSYWIIYYCLYVLLDLYRDWGIIASHYLLLAPSIQPPYYMYLLLVFYFITNKVPFLLQVGLTHMAMTSSFSIVKHVFTLFSRRWHHYLIRLHYELQILGHLIPYYYRILILQLWLFWLPFVYHTKNITLRYQALPCISSILHTLSM